MAFDIKAALAKIAANPQDSGDPRGANGYWTGGGGDGGMGEYTPYIPFSKTGSYFNEGMALTPMGDGTWAVYKPVGTEGASKLNGTTFDIVDAQGNKVGQNVWRGITDQDANRDMIASLSVILGGYAAGSALAGAGAAGGAAGGGAGGAGLGGGAATGADMSAMYGGMGGLGEVGAGGLSAAEATAGAGFLGDATAAGYGGLDAASTSTMGGGASGAWGGGAQAVGGAGGIGAAGGAGGAGAGGGGAGAGAGAGGFDWGSLVGPAISAVGGAAGASAAGKAADAQLQATREAAALQEPFRQGGMAAMNRLLELNGIGGNPASEGYGSAQRDFTAADFAAGKDPGYAWRLEQGQQGLERAASAGKGGGLGSGGYLKDAMAYNSGLASQEFGNSYNRYQTNRTAKLNPLQSLMGAGQTAANTIGGYTIDGGNATAAGKVGQANALTGAIGQGWSMYQNGQQQTANNALMDRFLTYKGA